MPPGLHRRGSTHQSFQPIAQEPTASNSSSKEKHRVIQQGTWTPKGAPARVVFGAVSDAGCSLDGQRKTNQDSFIAAVPHPFGSTSLFAVFDGHGENGHLVSRQVMAEFGRLLHTEQQRKRDLASAMTAAYMEQDRACTAAVDCSQSGTTAVTCFLKVDSHTGAISCHAAWAGDSRAVLGCVRPDAAKHLLEKLLAFEPNERPSLEDVARHAWLSGGLDTVELNQSFSGLQSKQEQTQRQLARVQAGLNGKRKGGL